MTPTAAISATSAKYEKTLRWNENGDRQFGTWPPTAYNADGNKAFTGWYLDEACTQFVGGKNWINAEEDVTLYAGWETDCWTVTLDANGGTVEGSSQLTQKVAKGQSIGRWYEAAIADAAMYFDGWNTKADGTGQQITDTWNYEPTADVTLYAQWSLWHVITLDANGGRFYGDPSQRTLTLRLSDFNNVYPSWYGEGVGHSDPHLTVQGWYWDAACTEPVDIIYTQPGENMDVTVYANWVPAYQVTLDANGQYFYGDPACTSVSFSVREYDSIYVNWQLERNVAEYLFDGWYRSPACIGDPVDLDSYRLSGDVTFYAGWKRMYRVTFDANGGRFDERSTAYTISIDESSTVLGQFYELFPTPYHEDEALAFVTWYFDAACTRPVGVGFRPTEDITLYAGWTSTVYAITFDANGEYFNDDPDCTAVTRFVGKGDVFLSELPDTYHDSACLNGWYLSADCAEESRIDNIWAFQPTADVTIYAGWTPRYAITFNANGGYFWNDPGATTFVPGRYEAGTSIYLGWETPKSDLKAFVGWSLTPDGSGDLYALEDHFTITGDTTFYAQWADAWFVTFDLMGVRVDGWYGDIQNGKLVAKGSAVNDSWWPNAQDRRNYFAGWYLDDEYTGNSVDVYNYVPTADTVFYAKWELRHAITLNANGGWFWDDTWRTSEQGWVRQGDSFWYNWYADVIRHANGQLYFDGWYLDAACTEPVPFVDYVYYPTGDMIIYAKWAQDSDIVEIDETNFPDVAFRTYVSESFDSDGNGWLSRKEIRAATNIYVDYRGISDLTGLAWFTDLQELYCYGNQLTALDVSANTALRCLHCSENQLTALDVSGCTAVE